MKFVFNPISGLIRLRVRLKGPNGHVLVRLALDTSATGTVIHSTRLMQVSYDPSVIGQPLSLTTAAGIVQGFRFPVQEISALGQTRQNITVVAHNLPSKSSVEGLLGLDFFRGQVLTIDFQHGEISLEPGPSASHTP